MSFPEPSPLGLYLHIPFCQSICAYCNFNRGLLDAELKQRYVRALEREIRLTRPPPDGPRPADTIFFGGGTPSLLDPTEVDRLIIACREVFDVRPAAEITLETNPETATVARLEGFRGAGVNRISFGVQSFDDAELRRLGRIHSAARAVEAIDAARSAGFDNVSLDLMCWLPGQSVESWRHTVDQAIAVGPEHLSMYLLELYPNAPLKEDMARAGWSQAPDDDAADMYLAGLEQLERAGYEQYEISNVARPGYWSRHNVKYWQSGNWHGFGCGAHSTVDGRRWKNIASTTEYASRLEVASPASVRVDECGLSPTERVQEALFTGMRLSAGIDRGTFLQRYGVDPWTLYGAALEPFVAARWVWQKGDSFGLTRQGMLVANEVLACFV